jgi:peptidoglycan hydrolase-like protein with peptidoglycan-binding domain
VVVFGAFVLTANASITVDAAALAHVNLPLGSGTIEQVNVIGGRDQRTIPVELRGDQIWPTGFVGVHETVTIEAVLKRPGWVSWLTGKTERVRLTLTTPGTPLRSHFLTLRSGAPLRLAFREPIQVIEYGQSGHLARHVLPAPQSEVTLARSSSAGTMSIAAAPRSWEAPKPTLISWFPAGSAATAVAVPAPGTTIGTHTPITLTFSKPISQALGSNMPPVSPITEGTWRTVNQHTIQFQPEGYGYGLGANVSVGLPSAVRLVGGQVKGSDPTGNWSVPAGSTLRLQQMLAMLGYLPFNFSYTGRGVAATMQAEEQAAIHPPSGTFAPRYSGTPSELQNLWEPGASGELTKGAVMAFENNQGMTTDGIPGPAVWKALINAVLKGQSSHFGYTFVAVSEGSPESIDVWHNGKNVVTGPVNTGIPAAPTAQGVFAVFEHLTVTTMTGYNPDGSYYSDPGIPWVSYFNGGDALHGFIRASYGFPQSLGCVEMPFAEAGEVWPYTPIGTIVDVS